MKTLLSIWEMIPNITKNIVAPIVSLGIFHVLLQSYLKRKAEVKELEIQWVELMGNYHAEFFRGGYPAVSGKLDSCLSRLYLLREKKKIITAMSAVYECFPDQDSDEFEELSLLINSHPTFYHTEYYERMSKVRKLIRRR